MTKRPRTLAQQAKFEKWQNELTLTPVQRRIVSLLPLGLTNDEIGKRVYLSKESIKTYLCKIIRDFQPHARYVDVPHVDRVGVTVMFLRSDPTELLHARKVATLDAYKTWQRAVEDILTEPESEIIALTAKGLTNRQIARQRDCKESTVHTHHTRIVKKLTPLARGAGVIHPGSRSGLVTIAIRADLDVGRWTDV